MKTWFRGVDLAAEKQPGEIEYSPLQLTRIQRGSKRRRAFAAVCIGLMMLGALFFVVSSRANDGELRQQNAELARQNAKLEAAIESINSARSEAKHNVCGQDYAAALRAINTAENQARKFSDTVTATLPRTPELQRQIDDFVAGQRAQAVVDNPRRDCSDPGIDDFYSNAPPAPPCDAGTDGKGYCR